MTYAEATAAFKEGKEVTILHLTTGKTKTFQKEKIAEMFKVKPSQVSFSNCITYGCAGWSRHHLSYSL